MKTALPERMADDHFGMSTRVGIVGVRQCAADRGLNSENLKVVSGDKAARKRIFGIVTSVESDACETGGSSDSREGLAAIAELFVPQIGLHIIEEHQPFRLPDRQDAENNAIDKREDCGVRAYSESQ